MKIIYCSVCGTPLPVIRKAVKAYGRIVDIIDPHECVDSPVPFDLDPLIVPEFTEETEEKRKFVQNLDNLRPSTVSTADLRDRRKEQDVKSSAPSSLVDSIKDLMPSSPEHELTNGNFEGNEL